jgi:hypothetical protein
MALPLTKPARGYLRAAYSGPVNVSGSGVTQAWDLTTFLPHLRADPMFKQSLVIFAKQSGDIEIDDSQVSFLPATGTPEQLVLTMDSSSEEDVIQLDVWIMHSILGAPLDGPRIYNVTFSPPPAPPPI